MITVLGANGAIGSHVVDALVAQGRPVYGPVDGPLTEDLPADAADTKGRVRAAMAQDLLSRHDRGELDVVIGQASDHHGPRGVNSVAGATLFEPAIAGGKVALIGSPDVPHTWAFLPDLARALVALADTPRRPGGSSTCPSRRR